MIPVHDVWLRDSAAQLSCSKWSDKGLMIQWLVVGLWLEAEHVTSHVVHSDDPNHSDGSGNSDFTSPKHLRIPHSRMPKVTAYMIQGLFAGTQPSLSLGGSAWHLRAG